MMCLIYDGPLRKETRGIGRVSEMFIRLMRSVSIRFQAHTDASDPVMVRVGTNEMAEAQGWLRTWWLAVVMLRHLF